MRYRAAVSFAMNEQARQTHRPATYQDVLDAPSDKVAELVRVALHLHPRPHPRHAQAITSLGDELVSPFGKGRGGPGGWWILIEPELHLGENVLVPDLAGWRRSRLPSLPDDTHIALPPDWVCEVISPRSDRISLPWAPAVQAAPQSGASVQASEPSFYQTDHTDGAGKANIRIWLTLVSRN